MSPRTTRRREPSTAAPAVDPDPSLVGYLAAGGRDPTVDRPVVTHRDVAATERALLLARIDRLERKLAAADRRHQTTVQRYERILARRTETFRSWVDRGDPRPGEFEWIGREHRPGPDGPDPTASGPPGSVATDGGRDRSTAGTGGGPLSRVVGFVRDLGGRLAPGHPER